MADYERLLDAIKGRDSSLPFQISFLPLNLMDRVGSLAEPHNACLIL